MWHGTDLVDYFDNRFVGYGLLILIVNYKQKYKRSINFLYTRIKLIIINHYLSFSVYTCQTFIKNIKWILYYYYEIIN